MYLVTSLLVLRAGCGIWLYQFLIIAYLFTLLSPKFQDSSWSVKLSRPVWVLPGCKPWRQVFFCWCLYIVCQPFIHSRTKNKCQSTLTLNVKCLAIWAASWQNLFMPYTNNKGADQPAHPHSLISTFVVRYLDSIISLVSISEISSLYLASVAEQAGLSVTWSQTPKRGFLVTWLIL